MKLGEPRKEEYDTLHNGHLWLGSGGAPGKHGVGILLHKRWAKYNPRWRAISPRLGVMELSVKQLKLTFAVVYMPHCGYKDESVDEMYSQLSSIVRDSRSRKRILIIAGDWNAEVESAGLDYERKDSVGRYANDTGNNRGDWLKRWATSERLVVANTLFKKRWGLRWTHEQHGRRRQIDYILVDSKYRRLIKDAVVEKTLDLGSDHRAVKLILNITDFAIKSKIRRRAASKCVGWKPQAFAEYHRQLDERLADFQRTIDLEAQAATLGGKCEQLDKIVRETAMMCSKVDERIESSRRVSEETVSLIRLRQQMIHDDCTKDIRREISKLVQNGLKKDLRAWKQRGIAEKLETFVDLKSIGNIRRNGRKPTLASVKNEAGELETSRQGIADVFASFYEVLYKSRQSGASEWLPSECPGELPEVIHQEIERES